MQVTGRVYQQPGTGQPYTVIFVNGERIEITLYRAVAALPVEIPAEPRGGSLERVPTASMMTPEPGALDED